MTVWFMPSLLQGPNPLSVLKKKKKPVVTNDKKLNNDEGSVKKKRKNEKRENEQSKCERGQRTLKWRRRTGERAGEGTSNEGEGWFWVAFTEDDGGKIEARSVGLDR